MDRIIIDPTAMRQFGDPEGATFVFVTNRSAADRFEVRLGRGGGGYAGDMTLFYETVADADIWLYPSQNWEESAVFAAAPVR